MATAGLMEIVVGLPDSTGIIFAQVECCLALHFNCCPKDRFLIFFNNDKY